MDLQCLSDVKANPLEWVWKGIIPAGKLTLLTGDPGVGKSLFALDVAARLTRGLRGPFDEDQGERGAVVLFTGEDDLAGTVRSRLDAAGADESWIHAVEDQDNMDPNVFCSERWSFQEDTDIYMLESYLKGLEEYGQPVRLIVIDPVTVFLNPAESQRDVKVRGMLSKLAEVAARFGAAILLVSQPPKSGVGKRDSWWPIARQFAEAARSVWMIVRDVEDTQRRMLLPVKTNLCEMPSGLGFSIRDNAILWEADLVPLTAEQFHAQSTQQKSSRLDDEELSELSRVAGWLKSRLSGGRVVSTIIRMEAQANEVSETTLRKAYLLLGCKKGKETTADGQWYWRLPGRQTIPLPTTFIEVTRTQANLLELSNDERS